MAFHIMVRFVLIRHLTIIIISHCFVVFSHFMIKHFNMWLKISVAKVHLQVFVSVFVSHVRRSNEWEWIWMQQDAFHHGDPPWHGACIFISYTSPCKSTATSKSQQTGCIYQMYPAYPNDKIINLLRLVDSLVRQQFEFILSWDQSLFNLRCCVSIMQKTSLFTVR